MTTFGLRARLGIRGVLLLGVLPPVLLALSAVGVFAYRTARGEVLAQKQLELANRMDRARADLARTLSHPVADLMNLSRSSLIASFHFNARYGLADAADASEVALRESFRHLLAVAPNYHGIAYVDSTGARVDAVTSGGGGAAAGDPPFDLAEICAEIARLPVATPRLPERLLENGSHRLLRYAVSVGEATGERLGTLVVDLDFAAVNRILDELALELGGAAALWSDGTPLAEVVRGLPSATPLGQLRGRAAELASQMDAERRAVRHDEGTLLGIAWPTPETDPLALGWVLGIVVPDAAYLQRVLDLRRSVLLLTLLTAGSVTAVCVLFVSQLSWPLRSLTDAIRRTGEGDLTAEVDEGWRNEIGAAARAFNRTLRALRLSRAALGAQVAETERIKGDLENLIEGLPSAVVLVDAAGHVRYWNGQAERQTGIARDAALARDLFELGAGYEAHRERFARVLRDARSEEVRRELVPGGDGRSWVRRLTLHPITGAGTPGVVLISEDVTAADRLERAMVQADKLASVGGLAAGMAHELNNPLAGIFSNLEILERRLDPAQPSARERLARAGFDAPTIERLAHFLAEQRITRHAELIRVCATRATRIVQNLLDFSRSSRSVLGSEGVAALVDNTLLLAQAEYDVARGYDVRDIEVRKRLPDDLPAVRCDRQQIEQVLLNLVKNAAQALAAKRRAQPDFRPCLTFRAHAENGRVCVAVEDNGPGIPPDAREHVFEPFFSTKDVGEGTGLGLSISYFIVTEGHGGALRVEDCESGGARFVLELPAAEAST